MHRKFVGVDGEGRNLDNGYHAYFMLRAGDSVIWNRPFDKRLRTRDMLDFISGLDPDCIYVGYFFDYDTAKILEDLPFRTLHRLIHRDLRKRDKGGFFPVDWEDFELEYFPRKELKVRRKGGRWVTINDVGPFFQTPFVHAIAQWGIGTPAQREIIGVGKGLRADFASVSNAVIDEYNHLECDLLAELMTDFRNVCIELDCVPRKWQGPGQLAERLMEKHGIPKTAELDIFGDGNAAGAHRNVCDPVYGVGAFGRYAYYGGWFETTIVGYTPAPAVQWDINSAYPAALLEVPCLKHGSWQRVTAKRAVGPEELSISFGSFETREGKRAVLNGFSVRRKDGSVHRPNAGIGWYWSFEVTAARHQKFTSYDSWVYTTHCDCKPFAFVEELYAERKRLGKTTRGYVIKLMLNSLYGKLVQSIGHPEYSNPVWGSFITAYVRTVIANAIHSLPACLHPNPSIPCGSDVYMVATDAIVTRDYGSGVFFDVGAGLGQYSRDDHPHGLFIIQPGVYFDPIGDNEDTVFKTRGVPKRKVIEHRAEFLSAFATLCETGDVTNSEVHLPITLITGIKQAVHRKSMKSLGQVREYVDPDTGQLGRRTTFEWKNKRLPDPLPIREFDDNGIPLRIRTLPYHGREDRNGVDSSTGSPVQTVPYSKDIGGLIRNEARRAVFEDQPDWIGVA